MAAIALPAGLLSAAPSAVAQAATCRGLTATIEGAANASITGTAGDDVIVAPYGSFGFVNAGDGNDVVCVVPGDALSDYEDLPSFTVQAGEGVDIIDSTALTADHGVTVRAEQRRARRLLRRTRAGPGDHPGGQRRALGGRHRGRRVRHRSRQRPGDVRQPGPAQPRRHRRRSTETTSCCTPARAPPARAGSPGVRGRDALFPTAIDPVDPPDDPLPPGDVVVDARTGTATVAGAPYLTWTGIDDYQLGDIEQNHVTFLGSARPEHVTLSRGTVTVRLGGGDDSVSHYYPLAAEPAACYGEVRPRWPPRRRAAARAYVDLATDAVVDRTRDDGALLGLAGFEDAEVWGRSVTLLRGTDAAQPARRGRPQDPSRVPALPARTASGWVSTTASGLLPLRRPRRRVAGRGETYCSARRARTASSGAAGAT